MDSSTNYIDIEIESFRSSNASSDDESDDDNDLQAHSLSGSIYAFEATGGFSTEHTMNRHIHPHHLGRMSLFDKTGAAEIDLDIRIFNQLIGVQKDAKNHNVISNTATYFDFASKKYLRDRLVFTAKEFVTTLNNHSSAVVHVGKLHTIYGDFATYIRTYFGMQASDFAEGYSFFPNNSTFSNSSLVELLTKPTESPSDGHFVRHLEGEIYVDCITDLLFSAIVNSHHTTRTILDGFVDGDIIFVPSNGLSITLNLTVDNYDEVTQECYLNVPGVPNTTVIHRTIEVPILIKLVNYSWAAIYLTLRTVTGYSVTIDLSGEYHSLQITRDDESQHFPGVFVQNVLYDTYLIEGNSEYKYTVTPYDKHGHEGIPQTLYVKTLPIVTSLAVSSNIQQVVLNIDGKYDTLSIYRYDEVTKTHYTMTTGYEGTTYTDTFIANYFPYTYTVIPYSLEDVSGAAVITTVYNTSHINSVLVCKET